MHLLRCGSLHFSGTRRRDACWPDQVTSVSSGTEWTAPHRLVGIIHVHIDGTFLARYSTSLSRPDSMLISGCCKTRQTIWVSQSSSSIVGGHREGHHQDCKCRGKVKTTFLTNRLSNPSILLLPLSPAVQSREPCRPHPYAQKIPPAPSSTWASGLARLYCQRL